MTSAIAVAGMLLAAAGDAGSVPGDAQLRTEGDTHASGVGGGRVGWTEGEARHHFVVGGNVAALLLGMYVAELEFSPAPHLSLYAAGGLSAFQTASDLLGDWDGLIGILGARWYPFGSAPRGLFLGVDAHLLEGRREGIDALGAGGTLGFSIAWGHFNLAFGLGARFTTLSQNGAGWSWLPSLLVRPGFSF